MIGSSGLTVKSLTILHEAAIENRLIGPAAGIDGKVTVRGIHQWPI
jgi:hypothetical protein